MNRKKDLSHVTREYLLDKRGWTIIAIANDLNCDTAQVLPLFQQHGIERWRSRAGLRVPREWLVAHADQPIGEAAHSLGCSTSDLYRIYKAQGVLRSDQQLKMRSCPCSYRDKCHERSARGLAVMCEPGWERNSVL